MNPSFAARPPRFAPAPLGAALALLLSVPLDATAEEADLGTIVVAATRTENPIGEVPAAVSVVDREAFDERQASALSEVLERLPGVDFGGGPRPAGQIPTIRGHYGKRVTLMVDGARRNEESGLQSALNIDPDMVAGAEVVRGSTSSLYGSGGIGGALALRTLAADDLLDQGQTFGTELRGGGESADESSRLHARVYGRNGRLDALAAFGHREWGEIDQGGDTTLTPNDGESDSALIKVGIQAGDRLRLEASHHYYEEEALRPNNPQGNNTFPMEQFNHVRQDETVFSFGTRDESGERVLEGRLYRTDLQREADANTVASLPATSSETDTVGGSLQHTLRLGSHRLTYGGDYYRDDQHALSAGAPNGVLPDGEQEVYGLFLQDELALGGPWRLVPSLRWDRFETHKADGAYPDTDDDHVSPKLALRWRASPELGLYASLGEAFRAPSLNEMYQNLSGNAYFANFAPNTDLDPELARTLEVGGDFGRGGVFAEGDRLTLGAALYAERVEDQIESAVIGFYTHPRLGNRPILQYRNVSEAQRWGIELEGRYRRGPWELGLAYTRMRAEDADSGANLFSPPDQLNLDLRYWFAGGDLSLLWGSTFTADQDYDSEPLRRRDGWDRHDLFLSWTPTEALRLDVGVENLFDERYAPYHSANAFAETFEKGRSAKATLSWRF